jgi:hypothetical protein
MIRRRSSVAGVARVFRAGRVRFVGASALTLLATCAVSGCESADKEAADQAAKLQTTCAKDAKSVDLPAEFPASATLPDGYVVSAIDKRDGGRTVVSAVSPKAFKETLKDMQATYSTGGWKLSEGEVEAADAESNFSGNGVIGRWAIRAMTGCEGNTGVSLVTARAG